MVYARSMTDNENFETTGNLLDIVQLTALFGEPDHAQSSVAAWTGDTCYSISGEPLPMWNPAEAAELAAVWRAESERAAERAGE